MSRFVVVTLAFFLGFTGSIPASTTQEAAACVEIDPCAAYPTESEPGVVGSMGSPSPATFGIYFSDFEWIMRSRLIGEPNDLMAFKHADDWYHVSFVYLGDEADCPSFNMEEPVRIKGTDVSYPIDYYVVHPGGDKAEPASTEQGQIVPLVCEMEASLIW